MAKKKSNSPSLQMPGYCTQKAQKGIPGWVSGLVPSFGPGCQSPKDSTPKLLELIQQFGSVAGYRINAQKSIAFLYINNETEETERNEPIPLTIAPKRIRYLGINLTKEVKDLYPKNYRTLLKEIEEVTKRW